MKPHHALIIAFMYFVAFGGILAYHFYLNWQPETIEVEKKVYLFQPKDKYAEPERYYEVDSVWSETGTRYVTEFWIGQDGIYYGVRRKK